MNFILISIVLFIIFLFIVFTLLCYFGLLDLRKKSVLNTTSNEIVTSQAEIIKKLEKYIRDLSRLEDKSWIYSSDMKEINKIIKRLNKLISFIKDTDVLFNSENVKLFTEIEKAIDINMYRKGYVRDRDEAIINLSIPIDNLLYAYEDLKYENLSKKTNKDNKQHEEIQNWVNGMQKHLEALEKIFNIKTTIMNNIEIMIQNTNETGILPDNANSILNFYVPEIIKLSSAYQNEELNEESKERISKIFDRVVKLTCQKEKFKESSENDLDVSLTVLEQMLNMTETNFKIKSEQKEE